MKSETTTKAAWDIRDRTLQYGVRAVKLYQALRRDRNSPASVIGKQYLRSATSVGANVAEAQAAESRRDFIHKYSLAQKEARESLYWLRLLERSGLITPERLAPLMQGTEEVIAVITTIIVRTKEKRD